VELYHNSKGRKLSSKGVRRHRGDRERDREVEKKDRREIK